LPPKECSQVTAGWGQFNAEPGDKEGGEQDEIALLFGLMDDQRPHGFRQIGKADFEPAQLDADLKACVMRIARSISQF
jgi:hypothetical protein